MSTANNSRPMSEIVTWWIGACVTVATTANVWALVEIRGVIDRSREVENQIVTITSATTALANRTTDLLEEIEQRQSESIPDMGFRAPATESLPEEPSEVKVRLQD